MIKLERKILLRNPDESAFEFADQIRFFYDNIEELNKCVEGCMARAEELSWNNKVKKVVGIYEKMYK